MQSSVPPVGQGTLKREAEGIGGPRTFQCNLPTQNRGWTWLCRKGLWSITSGTLSAFASSSACGYIQGATCCDIHRVPGRVLTTHVRPFKHSHAAAKPEQELESLHKLEVVSLENFLDGQVLAGKATSLEDGFRRKREQLFSSQF